ncbi:hypothetical protein [Gemmatimonas sp.]|uniref:hypothetical protein n=1 Tax=Gemmatimonas sp. TaxID=1962908 RepID=UPI003DA1CD8B
MSELTQLPTATLHAMKARLTNWVVYVAAIDLVAVGVFVSLLVNSSPAKALPFAPLLMLPSIALVPLMLRAGAVRRELARRDANT